MLQIDIGEKRSAVLVETAGAVYTVDYAILYLAMQIYPVQPIHIVS